MSEYIIKINNPITFPYLHQEIVRCRDCAYNAKDIDGICYRFDHEHFNQPDGFCAWAVKRKEGVDGIAEDEDAQRVRPLRRAAGERAARENQIRQALWREQAEGGVEDRRVQALLLPGVRRGSEEGYTQMRDGGKMTTNSEWLKGDIEVLRGELAKRDKGIERLKARRDGLQEEVEELKAELAIANVKLEGKPDCVPCDRTTLLTEVESLKAERDEWKEKALRLEHRLNMELVCSDKSIIEALGSDNRELADENARLKADRDSLEHDLDETEAKFAEEMAETLSLHGKQQAASHQAWVDAADERDYWRQEVQYCMDAAYPPSHAPERPYSPHVMDYPPSGAYTTPSTMVSAVIDGLRDEKIAEWKGVFEQLSKAEAERDRYRELASELLDAAHNMQLIADRGLA